MKKKKKMYVLGMFPYPSGAGLHVGHVRIYTACDVMARYFKAKEYEVLHPMGWDAFGLPAENAAIKFKTNPMKMVPKNQANFKHQLQNLEMGFDWSREFSTTDPTYYGLTQWLFLKLYEKGLVYREKVPINWCPKCKTGIANEEVLGDGTHERCGTAVERREMWQWVMRITEYADRLLEPVKRSLAGLDLSDSLKPSRAADSQKSAEGSGPLEELNPLSRASELFGAKNAGDLSMLDWPRGILEMQKNWIGRKEGARVKFTVRGSQFAVEVEVFTTRLDTIFGVTFLVVAPEKAKEWMEKGWQASGEVKEYVDQALRKTERARMQGEKEKTGVKTDLTAVNPANGVEVPVYVADYVLASVGTGAVMGVPAHDERDWEFAKKYGLPIKKVVSPDLSGSFKFSRVADSQTALRIDPKRQARVPFGAEDSGPLEELNPLSFAFTNDGVLVNSGKYTGMKSGEAREAMLADLKDRDLAEKEVHYHLRDWVFSRQRYWGEPIPLVHCEKCGVVPLPEKDLPLELPRLESYEPTDTGESPLSRVKDWMETKCPVCGGAAKRETDTMPNWAGSCWYFLAFPFWQPNMAEVLKTYKNKYPDKPYTKFWEEVAKPAMKKWMPVDWYLGGAEHAVLHLLYARFWVKVFKDMGLVEFEEPFKRLRLVGIVLAEDGRKMSKSWGNVVNPDDVVKEYGADTVRMYEMFMGPWDQSIAWDTRSLVGQKRFLEKVKELVLAETKIGEKTTKKLKAQLYKLLSRVEKGILKQKFNTSIAGMMEFANEWKKGGVVAKDDLKRFLVMLAPFAPGLAEELWREKGFEDSVHKQKWPEVEEVKMEAEVEVVVQVNGKKRGVVRLSQKEAEDKDKVMELVRADERVRKWVNGEVKKTIFVPGRLVNLVG